MTALDYFLHYMLAVAIFGVCLGIWGLIRIRNDIRQLDNEKKIIL